MSSQNETLEKEFELERLVLFSDAVFAIAITLLIIEIKFPEVPEGIHGWALVKVFQPAIIEFCTFLVSFLIIGVYWSRHLQLCKYLKAYDRRVVVHNLFFLFFVVTFPFTASGIGHFSPSFHIPMHLYIVNLFCLSITYYLFVRYVFKINTELSVAGKESEKNYMLMQSKLFSYMLASSLFVVLLVFFLTTEDRSIYRIISYQSITLFALMMAWRLKKYKPKRLHVKPAVSET